jgi:hypothetical protein
MPDTFVNQARYIEHANPVCGTVALAPCVGVAIPRGGGQWFIAHIDCGIAVPGQHGEAWQQVATSTHNTLVQLLPGMPAGTHVHIISTRADFSSHAICDGIITWAQTFGGIVQEHGWDRFRISQEGNLAELPNGANNAPGDGAFSVP